MIPCGLKKSGSNKKEVSTNHFTIKAEKKKKEEKGDRIKQLNTHV